MDLDKELGRELHYADRNCALAILRLRCLQAELDYWQSVKSAIIDADILLRQSGLIAKDEQKV